METATKKAGKGTYVRIVVCCALIMMTNLGSSSTFSVCLSQICEVMECSRAAASMCSTFCSIGAMICLMFQARIIEKIGPKRTAILGVFGGAVHYLGYIFSPNIYICWFTGFLGGVGTAFCGGAVLSLLLTNWFVKWRATMITLVTSLGIAYIWVTSRVAGILVATYSFRVSYIVWVLTILVIGLPAALLLINSPKDVGLEPFGAGEVTATSMAATASAPAADGVAFEDARRSVSFWLFAIALICMGIAPAVFRFIVDFWVTDCGFDQVTASTMYGYLNLISAGFLLIYGRVTDKMGGKAFSLMVGFCIISGTLLLLLSSPSAMPITILALILYSATSNHAMQNTYPSLNAIGIFGAKDYKKIVGFVFVPSRLGAALSNTIIGGIRDITGNYQGAFIFCAALGLVALLCVLVAYALSPYRERRIKSA